MNRKHWIILYTGTFLLLASTVYALNLSRVKTWTAEVLTHTDLNAEFDNILNHEITNADVSSTAAIVGSKLNLTTPGAIGSTTASTGAFTTLTVASDAVFSGDLSVSGTISGGEGATVGTFTRDISLETDLSITGLGYSPVAVMLICNFTGSSAIGFSDGVTDAGQEVQGTTPTYSDAGARVLRIFVDGSNYNLATMQTLDEDGFTLAWAKVNSPTGTATIKYIAFRN